MAGKDAPVKRRLFVGTFLSESDKRRLGDLSQYQQRLSDEWQRKVRFVRAEKLHLTWLFLGDVEEQYLPEIIARMERLAGTVERTQPDSGVSACLDGRFDLDYTQPAFWPDNRWPGMLVLVPDSVPPAVKDLAGMVKKELRKFLQKDEKRSYRPHITLMRIERGPGRRVEIPDWFPVQRMLPVHHHITQLDLIQSHLGSGKDRYESLKSFPL